VGWPIARVGRPVGHGLSGRPKTATGEDRGRCDDEPKTKLCAVKFLLHMLKRIHRLTARYAQTEVNTVKKLKVSIMCRQTMQ
jgi:hypothetical protein